MWVEHGGTADFCDVILIVQNNMGGCGDISNAVVGMITTELEQSVAQVEVTAQLENGQIINGISSLGGAYQLASSILVNEKVTVTPAKKHWSHERCKYA